MADQSIPQSRQIVTYSEAKERGLVRYFTGKPCKHGHIAERESSNGSCCECGRLRNARQRAANPELARQRYREWKSRNPDVAKASTAKWRANNPDKVRKHARDNYRRNKKKTRVAWQRKYTAENSEAILARVNAWQAANPEKVKQSKRNWRLRNPDKVRANTLLQIRRRLKAEGRFTADDIAAIFKAQKGKCAYCRKSLKQGYHIDHIIALANGGTNWPANLQLCCEKCNCRKSDKDPVVFAQAMGLLV